MRTMTNDAAATKKKVIDIKGKTFRALSVMAAQNGTNLKNLIEGILDRAAEKYDDSAVYGYLLKNDPEGKDYLNEKETKDFEKWLDL
jgi:macrodomain Ter protein organizer (MatP/YcbG family)